MAELPSIRFESNRVWAIPLFDSDHRKWDDKKEFQHLRFDWSDIPLQNDYSPNSILIAVTKRYKNYSNSQIQNDPYVQRLFPRINQYSTIW